MAPQFTTDRPLGAVTEVFLEPGFSAETVAGLRARGHRFSDAPQTFGGYQGIEVDHARGVLLGGSDPRRDGCAMG